MYTPSPTRVGERVHLASAAVDLDTHILDVLNALKYEALSNVVLVGHSYAGMVVTGAADRAPERIATLVYLDAFVPKDGEALADLLGAEARGQILGSDGWIVPARAPQQQGMSDPDELAWLAGRRDAQPGRTFTQALSLAGRYWGERVYVCSSGYAPSSFSRFADEFRADPAWAYHELATHHYPHVSMPQETAQLLLRYA